MIKAVKSPIRQNLKKNTTWFYERILSKWTTVIYGMEYKYGMEVSDSWVPTNALS